MPLDVATIDAFDPLTVPSVRCVIAVYSLLKEYQSHVCNEFLLFLYRDVCEGIDLQKGNMHTGM